MLPPSLSVGDEASPPTKGSPLHRDQLPDGGQPELQVQQKLLEVSTLLELACPSDVAELRVRWMPESSECLHLPTSRSRGRCLSGSPSVVRKHCYRHSQRIWQLDGGWTVQDDLEGTLDSPSSTLPTGMKTFWGSLFGRPS